MRKILISSKGMDTILKKSKKNPEIIEVLKRAKSKLGQDNLELTGNASLLKGEEKIYVLNVNNNYRVLYTLEENAEGETVVLLLSIIQKKSNRFGNNILKDLWHEENNDDDEIVK